MLQKKSSPFKKLQFGKLSIHGRNNTGQITIYHRGAGVKKTYRIVDFSNYLWNIPGLISTYEYDPNRTGIISMISYANNVICYRLAVNESEVSNLTTTGYPLKEYEDRIGCVAPLKSVRPGSYISSVEFKASAPSKYTRAGGSYAKLVSITGDGYAIIKLRSKILLRVSENCLVTIGSVRRWASVLFNKKNAGFTRRKGFRPTVRGVAMNPIDHPHGGGQGKTSGGRVSVSPWAKITKGLKTTRKIRYGSFIMKG